MIDEKKLIERLESIQKNDCKTLMEIVWFDGILAIIESQPKVGEWIPVEEGLPESLEFVDITFTYETFFGEIGYMSSVAKYDGYVWWNTDGDIVDENVIAWKPRSDPYRKEDVND